MNSLLKELWYGNLTPSEAPTVETAQEKRIKEEYWEITEKFESLLSKEQVAFFEKREDISAEIRSMGETNAFADGFCLGARLMIEVLDGNKKCE